MTTDSAGASLKRGLNLPLLLLYGIGNILGAGIYVLVGQVAASAGYQAPLAFLLAATVAAFSALSYVELSSRFPLSAGEAVYIDNGFHRRWLSVTVGLLVCTSGIISAATLSKGFIGYLHLFAQIPEPLAIILLLGVLGAVAFAGITESVLVAGAFTLLEAGGLVAVIWVARGALGDLPVHLPDLVPAWQAQAWLGVFAGAFLSFFAFIGFEDMVNVAEEVRRPQRTLPAAIILALIICTVLYATIATVAVLAVSPAELAASDAPLALVYHRASGNDPLFIGLIGMFAIINGILIQVIMVSRILYGMSTRGWLPTILSNVHPTFRTPTLATLLVVVVIMALGIFLPFIALAAFTSFVVLLVFALSNAALIAIKRGSSTPMDAVIVPEWIPWAGLLTAILLAAGSILVG